MVVCVECLPANKPWDVKSVTRRSSGVAPRACVRVHARVLVPPNLYIHTYINTITRTLNPQVRRSSSLSLALALSSFVSIKKPLTKRMGRFRFGDMKGGGEQL